MSCCDVPPVCTPKPKGGIYPFWGFTAFTPTIPKSYWQVKSQEQRILAISELLDKLICFSDYLGDQLGITREELLQLKAEFEEFKAHGFEDYYLEQIERWINEHMEGIVSAAIHMVFFGLTPDGYFCAYIPQSWYEIVFDTIQDFSNDQYGCLVLKY